MTYLLGFRPEFCFVWESGIYIWSYIKSREFNAISALNKNGQLPDCSGVFETTTGVYTGIIQTDTSVLKPTWNLIDPANLILKLDSFKEQTAN